MARRSEEIDDSFYSRQRYVIGDNAMVRLSDSTVLICGLGGVGIEIAKNLVLAGVKELILDDSTICSVEDLATQFYIRPEDVEQKRTRAQASRHCLEKLNPYVIVSVKTNFLTAPSVGVVQQLNSLSMCDLQCMVVTDCHLFFAALLNNYCRQHHIKFVYANSFGVFGNVFCDFGHEIEFGPPDEEPPESFFIESIENAEKPKLVVKGLGQHKIPDRGLLTFHEVSGMVELNNKTVEVRDLSPRTLELNIDTRSFGEFAGDGLATEVKRSRKISHFPLAQQLENPKICTTDLVNPDSSLQMHVAFLTLMAFIYARKRFPKAWGKKDAKLFCKLAKRFRIPGMEIDLVFMEKMSFTLRGHLAPLCSFFGGVAAQEVIKGVTESFTPLNQWVYLGVDSLVPSHFQNVSEYSIK